MSLRVADVDFAYRARRGASAPLVLRGVSLALEDGAFVGLLGPNGSGKSTLLRLMSGVLTPLAGHITLDGRRLAEWPRRQLARAVAAVPQETHPAFDYSALEMVLMGRYAHLGPFALEGPDDYDSARAAMEETGTRPFEDRAFSTLSGGEKQRVVIAAALAQAARLLLLDEPTASLDLAYQLEVLALLRRLHGERGLTIVLCTHDLNLAASVCQRLILLRGGRIVAAGPTVDVLTPSTVQQVYDVEADIRRHPATGHLTVVPLRHQPAAR